MKYSIDAMIVVTYFVIVFVTGFIYSRRYSKGSDVDFLTGGHHLNWWQTGMTLIAMMIDPGIMGFAAFGFLWGFYVIQWNAVNIWFTGWFSAMFFVGIYWRSKIVTTPEYLEKRFNSVTRAFFSVIMVATIIAIMIYAVYMGALLMNEFVGWNIWVGIIVIAAVTGFYVIYGGIRTMLALDIIQGTLLLLTLVVLGIASFVLLGGFAGIQELEIVGKAGTPLKSFVPPMDFRLTSPILWPFPSIPTYCAIMGLSWIVCNFSMAQRLLASKDESHAQKALIMGGIFNVFLLILAYSIGVAMRKLMPDVMPDKAFITLLLTRFPVGVRGLLIVGLIAALLSTVDGLISSSSSLITQDIYLRFINPKAEGKRLRSFVRILQIVIVLLTFVFVQAFMQRESAYQVLQNFLGNVMGVLIAIYALGIFSVRTTSWASFTGMIAGVVLSTILDAFTEVNFAHIGTLSFLTVIVIGIILSKFEKPKTKEELENLTVWTLPDVKGPWIGLRSWPGLKKWAVALPATWLIICLLWELYMMY